MTQRAEQKQDTSKSFLGCHNINLLSPTSRCCQQKDQAKAVCFPVDQREATKEIPPKGGSVQKAALLFPYLISRFLGPALTNPGCCWLSPSPVISLVGQGACLFPGCMGEQRCCSATAKTQWLRELEYRVGEFLTYFPIFMDYWQRRRKGKKEKKKGKEKKAHFGIQPDISFVFLLIAWSHSTSCWGPPSPTSLPSLPPPCSPPQPLALGERCLQGEQHLGTPITGMLFAVMQHRDKSPCGAAIAHLTSTECAPGPHPCLGNP